MSRVRNCILRIGIHYSALSHPLKVGNLVMPASTFRVPPLRVLIVEDNIVLAAFVRKAFEEAGHRIVGHARTVEQGLVLISECEFEIALLDVDLNGRNSEPLALELRKRKTPFVVTTGSERMMTSAHSGAPLVLKPFKIDDLVKAATRFGMKRRRHLMTNLKTEV